MGRSYLISVRSRSVPSSERQKLYPKSAVSPSVGCEKRVQESLWAPWVGRVSCPECNLALSLISLVGHGGREGRKWKGLKGRGARRSIEIFLSSFCIFLHGLTSLKAPYQTSTWGPCTNDVSREGATQSPNRGGEVA